VIGSDRYFHCYVAERWRFEHGRKVRFEASKFRFTIQVFQALFSFDSPSIKLRKMNYRASHKYAGTVSAAVRRHAQPVPVPMIMQIRRLPSVYLDL
jgi:hypothetical protein